MALFRNFESPLPPTPPSLHSTVLTAGMPTAIGIYKYMEWWTHKKAESKVFFFSFCLSTIYLDFKFNQKRYYTVQSKCEMPYHAMHATA